MNSVELLFTVHVTTKEAIVLEQASGDTVVMIPFTGYVKGSLFEGVIAEGGVDTQIMNKDSKKHSLSARYMIEGKDKYGEQGKLYIENNGFIHEPNERYLFRTYPKLITNCTNIKWIEKEILVAEGAFVEGNLQINVYRVS